MSWGKVLNLRSDLKYEINELEILPHQYYSSERKGKIFLILDGEVYLYKLNVSSDFEHVATYKKGYQIFVSDTRPIHLNNESDEIVKVLEVILIDT